MKAGMRLDRKEICSAIPHRSRNLVLDRLDFFEEEGILKSRSHLRIAEGDPEGRDIFLKREADGRAVYSEAVLVEHVALTSSVQIAPDTGEGKIAFFSTITNFRGAPWFPAGEDLEAVVTPLGRRGPFHRSHCEIHPVGRKDREASVDLMAAVAEPTAAGRDEGEKKKVEPPAFVERRPVDRDVLGYKPPHMVFLDEETALDRDRLTLTGGYLYPSGHPFTEGHFPDNPVMMGVTQWEGLVDCAAWMIHRLSLPPGPYLAEGNILRDDGTLVTEIKGVRVEVVGGGGPPRLLATKRIGFRDMVRAGEKIYYRVVLKRTPS